MTHFAWWNRNILNPIMKEGMNSAVGQQSMWNLKCILQHIMLRRTKQEKADDLVSKIRSINISGCQLYSHISVFPRE